jgi:hypothetical protein
MQKGRTGPWKSGDKKRASYDLLGNLRVTFTVVPQQKTVAKHAKDIAVSADPPDKIQARIGFQGFEKDPECKVKRLIAGYARIFEGLFKKGFLIETDEGRTVRGQKAANRPDQSRMSPVLWTRSTPGTSFCRFGFRARQAGKSAQIQSLRYMLPGYLKDFVICTLYANKSSNL